MKFLVLPLALVSLCGCTAVDAGNSAATRSSTQLASSTVVTPATAQIRIGEAQQFSAAFSGLPVRLGIENPDVTWSVNGIPGGNATVGTISAEGLYTPPASLPNPNPVKVTVNLPGDPSTSAAVPLRLTNPIPTLTSVSPTTISVGSFTLTVNGGGFVRGAEVLFAGTPLPTTFNSATQLTATGVAAQAQVGSAQIGVLNPNPGSASSVANLSVQVNNPGAILVSVGPPNIALRALDTQQFTATIQGTSNSAATWSVNGVLGGNATVGIISAAGLYAAPATLPNPNIVNVTAASAADPSVSATVPLTLYNPIPVVTSISPNSVSVGSFTLTVSGSKFVTGAQVVFAGNALQTTFNSASQLTAVGTATAAQLGSVQVSVRNSNPGSASSTTALNVQVTQPLSASQFPSQDPAGIFDGKGNFDAAAYVSMASKYGTAAMIPERFGSPWTTYNAQISAPTWSQANGIKYIPGPSFNPYDTFYYSRGVPCTTPDDYSSDYAQAAYVTDTTVSGSVPGVDGIETIEKDHCVWAGQPQVYWAASGGHPTATLQPSIVSQYDAFGMPQQPVEVTRAYGASEWAACSYMVFQTGQIACGEGGNTGMDPYYFKPFPADFVPTAASVTNNGEFLLVTGWNTESYKGELAVLAMGSSKPAGQFWGYEWTETYPGFRNYSLPVFNKLLGIIDLPGMIAPTEIEAVGNWVFRPGLLMPGSAVPGKFPLSDQSNWQCFVSGSCANLYDTGGFALVASRYERKVLLLDLTPLFQMVGQGMFNSWDQFRANVANVGTGAGQWPPTFAENPGETPIVVKTIEYSSQVTAISASLYPDNLAFIATEDGVLHLWSTDGLQTGTGSGANATEISSLLIGNNITRIAHMKHWLPADTVNGQVRYQYLALSRGDKTVTWVDMSSGSPAVLRVLSDSRLVDPITAEDNNNHMTQSDLVDVADYGDKNVKAYRYGPVIFWGVSTPPPTFGMGPGGTDPFEYEGAYATPTGPFAISSENVP
jgi:IPT/TIG domain-containing protein